MPDDGQRGGDNCSGFGRMHCVWSTTSSWRPGRPDGSAKPGARDLPLAETWRMAWLLLLVPAGLLVVVWRSAAPLGPDRDGHSPVIPSVPAYAGAREVAGGLNAFGARS